MGPCFALTDEQNEIVDMTKKFVREEIIPVAAQYDKTGEYPWPVIHKAFELGLMNNHIPADLGEYQNDFFPNIFLFLVRMKLV